MKIMKNLSIKNLVKPPVRNLTAYQAYDIPCKIKLDANESPYAFMGDLSGILKNLKTNRYPDPEARGLKRMLAKRLAVSPANILFGNGSDELISYMITAFGGPVLFPAPTFSMYGIISQALGEKAISIPLDREFDIDLKKTLAAMKKERPKLIFLSSPNNPTGNCFSSDKILKIIEASRGIVVVDEAYQPFSSEKGLLPLLKDYRNLVILRTLSKIGLAALRIGFMAADPEIINEVNKVRLPFNLNSLSQAVAVRALKEKGKLASSIRKIVSERELLFGELKELKGLRPYPSEANFILFSASNPGKVWSALIKKGILVRDLTRSVRGCLRVTVGTPEENKAFLKALKEICG